MKLFVWDLHGVLEKGNDRAVIDISNAVLARFGHDARFTYRDGVQLYGQKWYEYFEWLLPEATHEYCLELQDACFELSEADLEVQRRWLTPTEHAWDVLTEVARKHEQIVISNTRTNNLEMFLKTLKLERFFSPATALAVDGHVQHARVSKNDVLRHYLAVNADRHYDDIVIIGDSASDMKMSAVAGGHTYLFTHAEFPFRECEADHRIRDLRDVLREV